MDVANPEMNQTVAQGASKVLTQNASHSNADVRVVVTASEEIRAGAHKAGSQEATATATTTATTTTTTATKTATTTATTSITAAI